MTPFQALKKFFIDDPIARTKKIYFWIVNYVGMHFPILYAPFYYLWILRSIRIDENGRVGVLELGSEFIHGCNLRCECCNAFSPYYPKGYLPVDELLESYAQWRKKIKPKYFLLVGGEPFLHPELTRIIRESAKIWNDSKLWLTTNGLLLDRVKPEVLQAIKETGYELIVTEHTFEPEHRRTLDAVYARLKKEGIPFVIRSSRSHWFKLYQYDERENPIPYTSNPKKAWNNCLFRSCTIIFGDKLYKCSRLMWVYDATQKGLLNAEAWKAALTYQPLTLQATSEEIVKFLRKREIPECTVCFEKPIVVPARQVPLKKDERNESVSCPDGQGEA